MQNLAEGTYTFTVMAASLNGEGVPEHDSPTSQDFALVIYLQREPGPFPYHYLFPLFFR